MANAHDPYGYYARKAAREAHIRNSAPYRIDNQPDLIDDFDALEQRLKSVSLSVDPEATSDGKFRIYDPAFGSICGYVTPAAIDIDARINASFLDIMPMSDAAIEWMRQYVGETSNKADQFPVYHVEHRYGPDILLGAHQDGLTVALNGRIADAAREG